MADPDGGASPRSDMEPTDQNVTSVAKDPPDATSLGALDVTPKPVEAPEAAEGSAQETAVARAPVAPPPVAAIPQFDVVRVEPSGEAVLAGRGSPGARVEIIANGEVIAEAEAGPTGEWVVVPDRPFPPGANDITARARLADGPAVDSEEKVAIAVPERPDGGMLIIRNRPNAPSEVLLDTTRPPPAAEPPLAAEQMPEVARLPFAIEAVEAEDRAVFVAGAGTAGAAVRVYADNSHLGDTVVGETGRWLFQGDNTLPSGDVTIRADMMDQGGTVVSRAEVPFSRPHRMSSAEPGETAGDTPETASSGTPRPTELAAADPKANRDDAQKPTTVIIRRGDNLWTIARRTYGRGIRYTIIFEANTDQIRNPHLIFPGQVFKLPENGDGAGN